MMMFKKVLQFTSASLLVWSLIGPNVQAANDANTQGVTVAPPSGFDEGTETQLSPAQVGEILPWANNSKIALADLLESTKELSAKQARDAMARGIQDVVLASAPKRTETLMRYVLNRALKVYREIQVEADVSQPGVVDQQIRLLRQSIQFALRYYQSDVAFLNGVVQRKADPVALPFAEFGKEYAKFLMTLDYSVFDASAQYNIAVMAIQLMQWDLYRDQNHLAYAPVIARIDVALKTLPTHAAAHDSDTVALLRQVKKTYLTAVSLLQKLGVKNGKGGADDESDSYRFDQNLEGDLYSQASSRELQLVINSCEGTYSCYSEMLSRIKDEVVQILLMGCREFYYGVESVECLKRGIDKIFTGKVLVRIMQSACGDFYPCFSSVAGKVYPIKKLIKGCSQYYYGTDKSGCMNRGINEMETGSEPLRVLQVQCSTDNGPCYAVQADDFPELESIAAGCNSLYYSSDKAACYDRAIGHLLANDK